MGPAPCPPGRQSATRAGRCRHPSHRSARGLLPGDSVGSPHRARWTRALFPVTLCNCSAAGASAVAQHPNRKSATVAPESPVTKLNTVTRYVETTLIVVISLVALVGIIRFIILAF